MLSFTLLMIESPFPQPTQLRKNFSDRYNKSGDDKILLDSYISNRSSNLDSIIVAKMDQHHIPGLAASIVRDGNIIWTGSYGYANIEDNIEVVDSTLFMLASVSKTVTGVALMKLWEAGSFELDDDINNYLPFEVRNPFFPDSAITFRMLLTHTSSINDNWAEMPYYIGDSPIPLCQYLEDYLVPGGEYYHTINYNSFPPGTNWDYCNVAVSLVGCLVEQIAGNFSTYCKDFIFSPLDMYETSWFLAGLDTTHIARPYTYSGGTYHVYPHHGYSDYPAGQLRTSALQLSRFLITFMQGGKIGSTRILDSTTVSLMTTAQYPQINVNQGLIWYRMLVDGRLIWGHSGGDRGVGTSMFYCPAEGTGVIFLGNIYPSGFINILLDALFDYASPVSVGDELTFPVSYRLYQNFPNPFNPDTKILYRIQELCFVTLKVFDVLGNEVVTLVKEKKPAGTYEFDFNADELPSSVYFYKLQAGSFVETKKMILLK
jgi:CubicO group peptidase (beta-lactamase class C family)